MNCRCVRPSHICRRKYLLSWKRKIAHLTPASTPPVFLCVPPKKEEEQKPKSVSYPSLHPATSSPVPRPQPPSPHCDSGRPVLLYSWGMFLGGGGGSRSFWAKRGSSPFCLLHLGWGKGTSELVGGCPPNLLPLEEWVSVAPPPIPHPLQHPPPGPSVRLLPPFFLPCPFFFCAHLEASPRQENEEVPGEARKKRFIGILYPRSF